MNTIITPTALNELYAARAQASPAITALALGVLEQSGAARSALWVRHSMLQAEAGGAYMPGLAEYGCEPGRLILVQANNVLSLLQAGLEGARTAGLGAVLIEIWGEARAYDLTASRRLALAARASGVTVVIARVSASPQPSAAETRWLVEPLPSRALPARSPGPPRFALSLLRARSGQQGLSYHLEWNRDERRFAILDADAGTGALPARAVRPPLSGGVAAFPADGSAAPPIRRAG